LHSRMCRLSMALVVQITRRTWARKANDGIMCSQARCHKGGIGGYLLPQEPAAKASSAGLAACSLGAR
jgi:hypothetical protein